MSFVLRIFDGESGSVQVQEIRVSSVRVGRSETCDVVLPSRYVSREQALLREEEGRFTIECVGRNVVEIAGETLAEGDVSAVRPDQEIRIAQFSLFIEAPQVDFVEDLDASRGLGQLLLGIHRELLERVDLRDIDARGSQTGNIDHRLFQALEKLVRDRAPEAGEDGLPEHIFAHALRESIHSEVIQDVLRRSGDDARADRAGGYMGRLDRVLEPVLEKFSTALGVEGGGAHVRQDLRRVEAGFREVFDAAVGKMPHNLKIVLVQRYLLRELLNLVCGFGPLQDLLELPNTSEIMVVHKDLVFIERDGSLERLQRTFITDEILVGIIQRIVDPLGRRIDRSTPLVDARLPDGSRVNAIIPPLAVKGPCLTIRKFSEDPLSIDDLVAFGSVSQIGADFLRACVAAHKNLIISGGTGSGKTTLLNVLSGFIGPDERIVTIEDSAELQLRQRHVVTLETRPPNVEGRGAYTIRDLVRNALRMRPDRIVVGECRGGEALDMLQAMNTGHDGSLTTLHANTPADALLRLETLVLEAVSLPVQAIRDQIEAAVHIIVQTQRLPSGKRMVTHVSEIVGIDAADGTIVTNDIFEESDGLLVPTGYLPTFIGELVRDDHIDPAQLFTRVSAVEKEAPA